MTGSAGQSNSTFKFLKLINVNNLLFYPSLAQIHRNLQQKKTCPNRNTSQKVIEDLKKFNLHPTF